MIYPRNFEQKIGFDTIRQMIQENCLSSMGSAYVEKIRFTSNFELLDKLLLQVEEFRQILLLEENFPSMDYFDLKAELRRIGIPGTYIEQEKLFDLKSSLTTIDECIDFIHQLETDKFPSILTLTQPINLDKNIIHKIKHIIDEKGDIRDNASSNLKSIRSRLYIKKSSIDRKINKSLKDAKKSGWVNGDAEVTIRGGRLVIPIPVSYKRQIRGFIHDQSATGQTVYIEPEEIFDTNNEIRELEGEERREIINILKQFSDFIRPDIPDLLEAYRFLGLIDFIRAKAKLAIKINGIKPLLEDINSINWEKAVHPLLYLSHQKQNKIVVPLNIKLDKEQRILVISGPNAGGKSVCLKTIGLLQYMLQCGLLIPVKENSTTGIFQHLFIDIGDEQSLENDLSTYSSHLMNMKHFSLQANAETLFLIDEFGTGTEPQLGGAIAEAILEKLNEKLAFGVITTHYSNLKILAKQGNGIVNGAMLFDSKAMQPLYQLSIGKPGSSFAFEIARKIGFPKIILKAAEKKTGIKQLDFDQQLQQLDIEKKELQAKQDEIKVADDFLAEMIEKYKSLNSELKSKKSEILEKAKKEAHELIESSNKLIENTIKEIRESQADKEKTKKLRRDLKEKQDKTTKTTKPKAGNIKLDKLAIPKEENNGGEINKTDGTIRVGDIVTIEEQDITGEALEINDDEIVVGFNSVTFKTQLNKVKKSSQKKLTDTPFQRKRSSYANIIENMNAKMTTFKLQLDVRGKRGEEAVELVRQYIDDAILLNSKEVKILHGKGYGILRTLIHDYLKTIPEIKQ
ncbi:MAG: Smr/MutS family protein, partial [Bacteroidales bacterium]|nr:Smr/MutS family protein [Bacteroidales bacterium]